VIVDGHGKIADGRGKGVVVGFHKWCGWAEGEKRMSDES
jgi:hypothetical protein